MISEQVKNGQEFCSLMGFQISKHEDPTYAPDSDCFSGISTLGTKYASLPINTKLY